MNMGAIGIWRTAVSGPIPTELFRMSSMYGLNLFHNSLSSTVPSQIGETSRLLYLTLAMNSLGGGKLPGAESDTGAKYISGGIPTQIGRLTRSVVGLRLQVYYGIGYGCGQG
jgi:hypothetical protein